MLWEVDDKSAEAAQRHRPGREGRRQADPRHRPGPRGRGDLLARAGGAEARRRRSRSRPVERVVFNAITKQAVLEAMKHPRADRRRAGRRLSRPPRARLSGRLHALAGAVAQAAGRALGRPRAVGGAAAGLRPRARDREIRRRANTGRWSRRWRRRAARPSRPAWSAPTARRSSGSTSAPARRPRPSSSALETAAFTVASVEAKPARRNPPPPFTTSTLQQEASRKLGFAPAHTMRLAQRLYEGIEIGGETVGLITYMRTDGVDMAPEAVTAIRSMIGKDYGADYVPGAPRTLSDQGEERAGGARGHPPDRRARAARARSRASSSPTRPGSTS